MTELGVQRTQWLVHHASLGAPDECAAKRDALAVTAGKTGYGALQQVLDAQEPGNLLDPPLAFHTRHPLALEWERDVLAHFHVRVQREQLEHEADISLGGSLVGHILPVEQDLALGRQLKTGDHSQGGGFELPTEGKILLDGEDVTYKRASQRDIGLVFQLFALYPRMTVRENIAFPLKCQSVPRAETKRRVEEVANLLRIEHLLERSVSGLSGGDSQRVALGRALVRRAKACMMDEPLGALDAEFRHLMCLELHALHDRIRATTVYVTHDQTEAMAMADRIAVMNHGVVVQIGSPQDIYDRPADMHVAGFIGSPPMSFLRFKSSLTPG